MHIAHVAQRSSTAVNKQNPAATYHQDDRIATISSCVSSQCQQVEGGCNSPRSMYCYCCQIENPHHIWTLSNLKSHSQWKHIAQNPVTLTSLAVISTSILNKIKSFLPCSCGINFAQYQQFKQTNYTVFWPMHAASIGRISPACLLNEQNSWSPKSCNWIQAKL